MTTEKLPWRTLEIDEYPAWVRAGGWQWKGYTSVWDSVTPDGYLLHSNGEEEIDRYGLDLYAVDSYDDDDDELIKLGLQFLAMEAWASGSVAVLHKQHNGAATLAVPAARIDYALFFEAITRFARSLGMNDNEVFTCTATVNLPHRNDTIVPSPSAK